MPRAIAFKCKTPGCEAWFPLAQMPDDTSRVSYVVLRLDEDPVRLQCPDCGHAHDYLPADKKEIQEV